MSVLGGELQALRGSEPVGISGRVSSVRGLTVLVDHLPVPTGALVRIGSSGVFGEVVGFDQGRAIILTLGDVHGITQGDAVVCESAVPMIGVGRSLLGRCVDGLGRPVDGRGSVDGLRPRALHKEPISAMERRRISTPMRTGVRVLDLLTPLGRGQRLGIFSGPGVGKSTLLGSIARGSEASVIVIALIGERGREVREFVEECLGPDGLSRSVLVVSTGDESPGLRVRAALAACSIAEEFCENGEDVLLMMDSVTRFAHAQRQVGLSAGEPPATRGYTPSVFSTLARLLERAGTVGGSGGEGDRRRGGSITGLYTVLVEGDDMTEPVADAARGILDGHLILSRALAQQGQFPAVDALDSISRVAEFVSDEQAIVGARQLRSMIASYRSVEELIKVGAYSPGSDIGADVAVHYWPRIQELLQQQPTERAAYDQSRGEMLKLVMESSEMLRRIREQQSKGAA